MSLCLESDIYKNFFRARHDFVLSLQTLELVQTKSNMSSHSVRFSSAGVLNLSNKDKANYFGLKSVETHKIDDSNLVLTDN